MLRVVFFSIPDCQLTSLWVPPICAMGGKAELTLMWEPHHEQVFVFFELSG